MAWMECQDGGDPAGVASPRDDVYVLPAEAAAAAAATAAASTRNGASATGSLAAAARVVGGTDTRCRGVAWGTDDVALLYVVGGGH